MRTIAQIRDAAAVHAKLKPIHDAFMKKNFKLTKEAYAAQHKEELDTFNKAVCTLMKLSGSTAVDFSALDAEFSALQSGSAELRTCLLYTSLLSMHHPSKNTLSYVVFPALVKLTPCCISLIAYGIIKS